MEKMEEKVYIAIDLKSFYASVECVERGLDPMTANLVVADESRTARTICLAVSPALKAWGIPGRPRLFEVIRKVREINGKRLQQAPGHRFSGSSWDDRKLKNSPELALDYIVAPPQMAHYMKRSTEIYQIYLRYIAPEDIHVYSIDEVFIDATGYLKIYGISARELAMRMILDVLNATGITAAAGIGTNLYLCKVAMDIGAKHIQPDENGVRIAELDEISYRRTLWTHRPLTDFWRVGKGYAKRLEEHGIFTMGDIAKCSLGKNGDYYNEELLYRMFGVNAELLIDHAWGWEPCTIKDIREYKPESSSVGAGQVLHEPYPFEKADLVVREMADQLSLDLVARRLVTEQITLTVGYDMENLRDPERRKQYSGDIATDRYGRDVPKHAHGTIHLEGGPTSSARRLTEAAAELYRRIADPGLLIRRITIAAQQVMDEESIPHGEETFEQLDLFTDYAAREKQQERERTALERERKMQEAMLDIKKKFGKNAILKGLNLQQGATGKQRNEQIGGHKA